MLLKHNATPALMKVAAIVRTFLAIQDPEAVLGVRYCCKLFSPPQKNPKKKKVQACLFSTLWSGQAQAGLKLDKALAAVELEAGSELA